MIIALKTKFYMDNDDIKNIEKWLDHSKINLFMEINRIREFELLVYARVLIFNKKYTDGELLLQRLLIFMQKINRKHSMVETLNLLSILEYQRGNTRKAIEYLNESLKIGLEEGYIRSYLDEFDGIVPLLRHYVMHSEKQKGHCVSKDFTTYAKDLLKQMQKSLVLEQAAQSSAAAEKIQKLLTNQEKTVLKLLLEAYTNKEIAQELDISIWTVKSHVGHIYDKLEVKNRVQCIKLSWEMHLFK
jgi:LuxR family maltose regulon positive regulatory protein